MVVGDPRDAPDDQVTVVVVTWRGRQWLEACLDAIRADHAGRTLVIDNASDDGTAELLDEALLVPHEMVGWGNDDDGFGIVLRCGKRADSDSGGGVPGDRLQYDGLGHKPDMVELIAHQEAVVVVAQNDGGREFGA